MDLKTLLSLLNSPETRQLLLKAVDLARMKSQLDELQDQVRRLQEEARDAHRLRDRLDKMETAARELEAARAEVSALRGRVTLALGLGGGGLLLGLISLVLALR